MWDYIKSVFSIVRNSISPVNNSQGNNMTNNIGSYIITAMGVFIVVLCIVIFIIKQKNEELQEQVKVGHIALEVQNNIIENNRAKNEALNKELQDFINKTKKDFSAIIIPQATHKKAENQCEIFIQKLAKAYQQ